MSTTRALYQSSWSTSCLQSHSILFTLVVALRVLVTAQELPGLVYSGSELNSFFNLLNQSIAVREEIAAGNCTVLAPVNRALANYNLDQLSVDDRDALLRYHVFGGVYASAALSDSTGFYPTRLQNTSYTNVTTGQMIEARAVDGNLDFVSGIWKETSLVTPDIIFNNGIIHAISNVLTIPTQLGDTITQAGLTAYIALGEVLGTVTPPNLPYLSDIQIWPDVTILAPNNSQFSANYKGWKNLSEEGVLDVWNYHLINGSTLYSTDLTPGSKFRTAAGSDVTIYQVNGSKYINDAKILESDLLIANGVIQVIDRPLNPNATSAHPAPSSTTNASGGGSRFTTGDKAGVGIGVAAAIVIVAGILFYLCRSRNQKKQKMVEHSSSRDPVFEHVDDKSDAAEMDNTGLGEMAGTARNHVGPDRVQWELEAHQSAAELEAKRTMSEMP